MFPCFLLSDQTLSDLPAGLRRTKKKVVSPPEQLDQTETWIDCLIDLKQANKEKSETLLLKPRLKHFSVIK